MATNVIHYFDSEFLEQYGRQRYPRDLTVAVRLLPNEAVVALAFSEQIDFFMLLPEEAEQLAESLLLIAGKARGTNETEASQAPTPVDGVRAKG